MRASTEGAAMLERISFHKFPLAGIDAMAAGTARTFPRHTHDQYGIGVMDTGGHASLSDRKQVEAGPGTLIFVNPGEVHDGRAIGGRFRAWRMLYVDCAVLQASIADIAEGGCKSMWFSSAVFADEYMRRLFDHLFAHASPEPGSNSSISCESALLRLIARAAVNSTAPPATATSPKSFVQRAREWIDDDPAAPLTLAILAREAGLSRYQLLRGFARQFGLTPHAYILQRRLAFARRLIRAGEPLALAAARAGFCDQSHLNRLFVRQFGVTPKRYAARRA
jgi:AraC-like DNA-binding protein